MNINDIPFEVGRVVEIDGQKIIVQTNENSNDLTYFYNGTVYSGIMVGQFIGILRGPYILVGRIEKEFLTDNLNDASNETYSSNRIKRLLQVHLIGYFKNDEYNVGIIAYPMIYNKAILFPESKIKVIIGNKYEKNDAYTIPIGYTVNEKIDILLDIRKMFNTHIGIFGNTGSGKSNTLAKIYTELLNKNGNTLDLLSSRFVIIDFNGEYAQNDVIYKDKKIYNLSTSDNKGDKLPIRRKDFWDIETLSILFSATEKTQKPFLQNSINYFLDRDTFDITYEKIINGICSAFLNTFKTNNSKESNKLLHLIYDELNINNNDSIPYYDCIWHEKSHSYYIENIYMNNHNTIEELPSQKNKLKDILKDKESIKSLTTIQKIKIAVYCQLIYEISYGKVQYDHVSPLISRIRSRVNIIDRLIDITNKDSIENNLVTVVSLKRCNTETKKVIPLLIAKSTYETHKIKNDNGINSIFNLIIDEAHNILSEASIREESSWKDYRLEVFEEIIKEGIKFGYYITLASQRPADISQTLVSQIHNYFLHRLVSEQDIRMINNTINTLDKVSKDQIPDLAAGQCIITGTSFDIPIVVQVDKLKKDVSPNSENADIEKLWKIKN